MKIVQGNLFDYDGVAIGHGVNTQGKMGAGIADQFRIRYPEMYESYKIHCENGTLVPGGVFTYRAPDGKLIANMASQQFPGADAQYKWLGAALCNAVADLKDANIHEMAIPKIGCGIGRLDWDAVLVILALIEVISVANDDPFEFIIYSQEAQ